jgi:hypothetical protein
MPQPRYATFQEVSKCLTMESSVHAVNAGDCQANTLAKSKQVYTPLPEVE